MKAVSLKSLNLTKEEIFNATAICQNHFGDYLKKDKQIHVDKKMKQ